jgi:hypothetical protein
MKMKDLERYEKVLFALALNRARIRTRSDCLTANANLWAHVFWNAQRAFDDIKTRHDFDGIETFGIMRGYFFSEKPRFYVSKADAIYQLLQDRKEMIMRHLRH